LKGYTAANYYGTFAGVPNYVHSHDLGLLYRSPDLTNVYVSRYYGMYNYGALGVK
jgi:hypothetical protein